VFEWDNKIGYELGILDEIFQEELNILRGMFIGKIIDGESYKDRAHDVYRAAGVASEDFDQMDAEILVDIGKEVGDTDDVSTTSTEIYEGDVMPTAEMFGILTKEERLERWRSNAKNSSSTDSETALITDKDVEIGMENLIEKYINGELTKQEFRVAEAKIKQYAIH
jgi:hypothetical protein